MASRREQLVQLIQNEAVAFGDFTLASGQKSTYYIDCRKVTLSSQGASLIGPAVLDVLADLSIDAIGGLTMGADPIVGAVLTAAGNTHRPLRGFLVRKQAKEHGTGKLVEGPLRAGDRVAVVEDVTTSGGSCRQAIAAVEAAGCTVVCVVTVLDRLAGAKETFESLGYQFRALTTVKDLVL